LKQSPFCHSGFDPWFDRPFDRLTVLSKVEGLTTLSQPVESLKVEQVEGESSVLLIICRI
jgi:hypothetical protein